MKTITLTERQRDALYSVVRGYAGGWTTEGIMITDKRRKFKDEEWAEIEEKLKESE